MNSRIDRRLFICEASNMDPLTQTIALLRPSALLWKHTQACGAWGVRFPSSDGVAFGLMTSGSCVLKIEGHQPQLARHGDFLLLPAPPEWSLSATADDVPVDFNTIFAGPAPAVTQVGPLGEEVATRFVGGHFTFGDENAGLLKSVLPSKVVIRSIRPEANRLRKVLDLIDDEAGADRPGKQLLLERLLEIMLVEAIRHEPNRGPSDRAGLLAGLADPRIAAVLRAVHSDVQRAWTVQDMAKIACMSRSVFASRFSLLVGLPPIDYLLRWRMALAKEALRLGRGRLSQVAQDVGYQSVSAFSAAFSRTVGCPPSSYAAEVGAG